MVRWGEILKRNRFNNNLRNNPHSEIGDEAEMEELDEYLAGAKKGTAPGETTLRLAKEHRAWEVNNRQLRSTHPALSVQQARSHVTSIFAEP